MCSVFNDFLMRLVQENLLADFIQLCQSVASEPLCSLRVSVLLPLFVCCV